MRRLVRLSVILLAGLLVGIFFQNGGRASGDLADSSSEIV